MPILTPEQEAGVFLAEEKKAKKRACTKAWKTANPEKVRGHNRGWYAANPEKAKERNRARYAANPEKWRERNRAWRLANPEKARAITMACREANPEKVRATNRAYREANPEQVHAATEAWNVANPGKKQAHRALRRAREAGSSLGGDPKFIEQFYIHARRVSNCTGIPFHVDHVIALAEGGAHHENNLQVLPGKLNMRKHTRPVDSSPLFSPGLVYSS